MEYSSDNITYWIFDYVAGLALLVIGFWNASVSDQISSYPVLSMYKKINDGELHHFSSALYVISCKINYKKKINSKFLLISCLPKVSAQSIIMSIWKISTSSVEFHHVVGIIELAEKHLLILSNLRLCKNSPLISRGPCVSYKSKSKGFFAITTSKMLSPFKINL